MTTTKTGDDIRSLNLYQKLAAITGEIGVVAKDGSNAEQKFKFIEYAAVAGKLRTLFAKYGVVVVPRMQVASKQKREEIVSKYGAKGQAVLIDLTFCVVNADKPDDKFTVTWTGEAADYGDKATNKAATSALKYYLMRQFNVSEKGEDADADSHEITSKGKPAVGSAPAPSAPSNGMTSNQLKMMMALFSELGVKEKAEQTRYIEGVAGKKLASKKDLTSALASKVIASLKQDIESVQSDGTTDEVPAEDDIEDGDIASLLDAADEEASS